MVLQNIDGIEFKMREATDFSFLSKYGRVFCAFAVNDSGNISFGLDNGKEKRFIKIAGTKTARTPISTQQAVKNLQTAIPIYMDLANPYLIQLIEHFSHNDLYIAVFKWVNGDCLFDYWNWDYYTDNQIIWPADRYRQLPIEKRIKSTDVMFSFLDTVSKNGYVAVDFYDGSIIYDFDTDITTICDIDFFRKKPTINNMGEDFWGTPRLKSPEEYIFDAVIDETTNVFTLGALIFNIFGDYSDEARNQMKKTREFLPCPINNWELNQECFNVASKSITLERDKRYATISEFHTAWNIALSSRLV
jgi:serine/threonine-protein kinase